MTEKRFKLNELFFKQVDDNNYVIIPILDNDKEISVMKLVELLNELHEENQDLSTKKEDAEYELLHLREKYEELLDENEYFKKKHKDILKLEKENEELKREMRIKDALSIAEWAKKNIKYGYYDNNSDAHKWLEEERRRALNCSDIDKVDLNKKRR